MVLSVKLLERLKIDDPIGAYPVHGANGIWGVVATGLFHMDTGIFGVRSDGHWTRAEGKGCLLPNLLGIAVIMIWTVSTTAPLFLLLKNAGIMRYSEEAQQR